MVTSTTKLFSEIKAKQNKTNKTFYLISEIQGFFQILPIELCRKKFTLMFTDIYNFHKFSLYFN